MADYAKEVAFFNQIITDNSPLSDEGKRSEIALFLTDCLGDMTLNEWLRSNAKEGSVICLSTDGVTYLLDLTFCGRKLRQLESFFDKAMAAFQQLQGNQLLNDEDKIELYQFAILRDVAKLNCILSKLAQLEISNDHLKALQQKTEQCLAIVSVVEAKINASEASSNKLFVELNRAPALYFQQLLQIFVKVEPGLLPDKKPNPTKF